MKKNLVTAVASAGLIITAFGASASAQENTYTVHSGDSLSKISKLNNVSINDLKDWNHLSDDKIYVNQKLSLTYTVKSGDSLWTIARSYNTSVSTLKSLNGLTSNLIRIGQQLKIADSNSSTPAPAPAPAPVSTTTNHSTYVVQKGDSLSTIGARFNLSVSQLKANNHLTTNRINVGQTLNVSRAQSNVAMNKVPAASAPIQPAAPSKSIAVEKPAAPVNTPAVQKPVAPTNTPAAEKPAAPANTPAAQKPVAPSNTPAVQRPAAPSNPAPAQRPAAPANPAPAQRPAAPANPAPAQKPAAPANSNVAQKAPATSASKVQAVIDEAKKYMGSPYSWGGNTPAGFDCSGYTRYVFNNVGISLPRTAETQWNATTPVNSPSVGDLVFFQTYKIGPSHVGIYLGNNKFISAASQGVVISDMTSTYWKTRYLGARSPY
ncbi:C40 family peptidase [Neobacillus massiliamazoniensis]|uniref:Peptidoglycan hydrolase n=1 Tax=Neobacillus massiliamazoniensis TaxID=1499688 RepID=A0A0U1NVX9_9BACI|nr:C40 family peptidase [Neobacillus massiliamazoniensis]CRK82190.1 peptidoglycan hydrolase [Neobacillus massiliamazoniensis]